MASQSQDYKFEGWVAHDKSAAEGNMKWGGFEPKPFTEDDVDIEISHCGICGSDCHTLRSGWGATDYPAVVGHEIVGRAVRVGARAAEKRGIHVGDRVGVGAQNDACLNRNGDCESCAHGEENHCPRMVGTYGARYADGSKSYGGYATHHRAPAAFVFKIPDALSSAEAAPMLCGGITVYAPLKRHGCGTTAKRVGIVGVGGLGHFGILFAKALGAEHVTAISRGSGKAADARKMGADHFIATGEGDDWAAANASSLDLIVSTVSSPDMPLEKYLMLLRPRGTFVQVGAPEDKLPAFSAMSLILKGVTVAGSLIGSPREIEEMLKLAVSAGVRPWVQTRPMAEANQAILDFDRGLPRYRFVLENKVGGQ